MFQLVSCRLLVCVCPFKSVCMFLGQLCTKGLVEFLGQMCSVFFWLRGLMEKRPAVGLDEHQWDGPEKGLTSLGWW